MCYKLHMNWLDIIIWIKNIQSIELKDIEILYFFGFIMKYTFSYWFCVSMLVAELWLNLDYKRDYSRNIYITLNNNGWPKNFTHKADVLSS